MELATYELPAHWASAFFNDDTSGLDDDDRKAIREFTNDMIRRHGQCWPMDIEEDTYFSKYHDAERYGVLACNVAVYTFDVTP